MILCFSGTGNTLHVSNMIREALGDQLLRLPPGLMLNPEAVTLRPTDGRLIWTSPVHSWGLPATVAKVMKKATVEGGPDIEHYLVVTCGDDCGLVAQQWRRLMKARGFKAMSAYSVQMPNSYTLLKGFDVDAPELAQSKLDAAPQRTAQVIGAIEHHSTTDDVLEGSWPWVKSRIVYPFFKRFLTSPKPFHPNSDCVGCGECARYCSLTNIEMVGGKPQWGKHCNMCLRCYHVCPRHAVQYGRATANKGQYLCPGYLLTPKSDK